MTKQINSVLVHTYLHRLDNTPYHCYSEAQHHALELLALHVGIPLRIDEPIMSYENQKRTILEAQHLLEITSENFDQEETGWEALGWLIREYSTRLKRWLQQSLSNDAA